MANNVLGLYKKDLFNKTLRVGTPDPTKYHDARAVQLEGAGQSAIGTRLPGNEKFALPGVIIPRATRDGASLGHDHTKPLKAFIDPDLTNGRLVVDLDKIRQNKDQMKDAVTSAWATSQGDSAMEANKNAAIEAYASFAADPFTKHQSNQEPSEPARTAPLQMPNTYVVPKASPGGGQVKPANFVKRAAEVQQPEPDFQQAKQALEPQPIPVTSMSVGAATSKARSLHQELSGHTPTNYPVTNQPMRKVTFELPMPGVKDGNMGEFTCVYSQVLRHEMYLILVHDHNNPSQMVWFPPPMEDPVTHEPLGIAALVQGTSSEPEKLYLVYPTGVKFPYGNLEFAILTIEKVTTRQSNQG